MTPLFSIITVCYNAADTLGPTLRSVDSQTCRLYEHLIVDGGSTDGTLKLLASQPNELRKVTSERDKGIYDAMNKGLSRAKGDYVIFLNAGDRFHAADTLETYAKAIMDNDYPGIVYGQTNLVDKDGRKIAGRHLEAPEQLSLKSFAEGMLVCHQAMAVLRRITPLYDVSWRFSADYEWVIRCLQHSRQNVYTGCVTADFLSEGTTTANRRRSLVERFRIMSHYYGFFPTLLRHLSFVPRFFRHKRELKRGERNLTTKK